MHDTAATSPEQTSLREENVVMVPSAAKPVPKAALANTTQPRGWVQFVRRLFTRMFMGRRASLAITQNQMPMPVAFKGDAICSLVTPISAYAGKPVEQAIRRRAEQQFKSMDVSKTTMN